MRCRFVALWAKFCLMLRLIISVFLLAALASCSKKETGVIPPAPIPDIIAGIVYEFHLTPSDITTPDKGFMLIGMNNTLYRVAFDAVDEAQSNAVMFFATDTVLTDASRAFANVGRDAVAYSPIKANEIEIRLMDGRKVLATFEPNNTNFGGTFGEAVIAQWGEPGDPAKPNQKAKDDLRNLIRRYADNDGPGPGIGRTYLSVVISKP